MGEYKFLANLYVAIVAIIILIGKSSHFKPFSREAFFNHFKYFFNPIKQMTKIVLHYRNFSGS